MPNIVITEQCNLNCAYCFANSSLNSNLMSEENFLEAISFIRRDPKIDSVGLIGGEPLLHPQIKKFIEILFSCGVAHANIFTNGLFLNEIVDMIAQFPHLKVLVNLNSLEDIGEVAYLKIINNIETVCQFGFSKQLSIGVNIYKPQQNMDFLYAVLRRFPFSSVRYAVAVPDCSDLTGKAYFSKMKQTALETFKRTVELGVTPRYDCNAIPSCCWDEREQQELLKIKNECDVYMRNIFNTKPKCHPVIDIFPDLTATRCFGLGNLMRVSINNFENIAQLRNYFVSQIDERLLSNSGTCTECSRFQTECYGGCLQFRVT